MIPHIHTLFEFISTPYENQHQTLNIKKIDQGQIRFREYSITLLQPKVKSPRPRSQCTNTRNLCLGHNSSLPCWIWIIFHTIVAHYPRVCHDFDPMSYLQGQGQSVHIPKICVGAITYMYHCHVGSGYYFTQLLSMTQQCGMTLTNGHISKVKVIVHTYPKSAFGS